MFAGCLGLPDDCRIVVLPSLYNKSKEPESNNYLYCKPIGYITGKSDTIGELTHDLKDYRRTRKIRHQWLYFNLKCYKLYPFNLPINLHLKDQL